MAASGFGGAAMKEYLVIYESGPTSWGAYVPDLPGCVAAAKTRAEVERLIREAIQFHIEGLRLHGDPIPEPTTDAGRVAVAA
jgi:predicted RNase H-like HicB family nuclease